MSEPDPPHVEITPAQALKAARAIILRAVDGGQPSLDAQAGTALHAALHDAHSEIGRLKVRLASHEKREIALVEQVLAEETRANRADAQITQALTHLIAVAYAKGTPALSSGLVAARAWLREQGRIA